MSEWRQPFPRTLAARRAELQVARERLAEELEAVRSGVKLSASGVVPAADENQGRAAEAQSGHWSVAEVVYHLHLSESSIARLLRKMLASSERREVASDDRLLEEWERIRTLVGSRVKKVQAPERVVPNDAPPLEQSLDLLAESRWLLLEVLDGAADQDLRSIYAPHPLRGLGSLAGSSWLSVIALHEWRHADQIRELYAGSPVR